MFVVLFASYVLCDVDDGVTFLRESIVVVRLGDWLYAFGSIRFDFQTFWKLLIMSFWYFK